MIKANCDHCKKDYEYTPDTDLGATMPDLCTTCIEEYKERVIPIEEAYHTAKKALSDEYGIPYNSFTSTGAAATMMSEVKDIKPEDVAVPVEPLLD